MAHEDDQAIGAALELYQVRQFPPHHEVTLGRERQDVHESTYSAVGRQIPRQHLGMAHDRPACECRDIRIIPVGQNARPQKPQHIGQKVRRPEAAGLAGPRVVWVAVETVDEHNVHRRLATGGIHLRQTKAL